MGRSYGPTETFGPERSLGDALRVTAEDKQAQGPKVFAKPFKVLLKKTEDQDVVWLEIKTLRGLKSVSDRVAKGELVPVDGFATLDRQLWGHLAEYVGFLRNAPVGNSFAAGIQPAGEGFADLYGDLSAVFGSNALDALNTLRGEMMAEAKAREPYVEDCSHEYVRDDGVNLTDEGEKILAGMVGERPADAPEEKEEEDDEESSSKADPQEPQEDASDTSDTSQDDESS